MDSGDNLSLFRSWGRQVGTKGGIGVSEDNQTMYDKVRYELNNVIMELSEVNLRRMLLFGRGLLHNASNKCKNLVSNKKLTNGLETPEKQGKST
ncbi:MAG: hypothetical protein M0R06_09305 [Sphaerochaeta sp.]|jgi:hypothetical protein|nr:hypothetical protein [Sphaerochaeta sp.]